MEYVCPQNLRGAASSTCGSRAALTINHTSQLEESTAGLIAYCAYQVIDGLPAPGVSWSNLRRFARSETCKESHVTQREPPFF